MPPTFPEDPPHLKNVQFLTMKLVSLGFIAAFTRYEEGPIVNTYFFRPQMDALLSKVMSRTEDLALSVGVESLLIKRERDEISIAVPRNDRLTIHFDRLLYWLATSTETREKALPMLMGQTTRGDNFTLNLVEQPHVLIGGSTGSGKSVFLNQLLCTLAVLKDPKDLKLILVDTKQLDLTLMSQLAHVEEMVDKIENLYKVMDFLKNEVRKRTGLMKGVARNIREYNSLGLSYPLPYYVVVIDELADIIGQDKELAKNEDKDTKRTRIAESLQTLAQISRAAGIHIIAATQRPDVKVVSGTIKVNFPTRICFKLPTGTDSRVILDENGAENLLGRGDYLYKTANDSTIRRAHGSFVNLNDIATILSQHQSIRESFQAMAKA